MAFASHVWKQLKNITKGELVSALIRDGFELQEMHGGSERLYLKLDAEGNPLARVAIHYHASSDTCGPKLLKGLLADIEWAEADMRRLKLIK